MQCCYETTDTNEAQRHYVAFVYLALHTHANLAVGGADPCALVAKVNVHSPPVVIL